MELNEIKCSVCPHTSGYDSAIDDCEKVVDAYFQQLFDSYCGDLWDLQRHSDNIRKMMEELRPGKEMQND